MGKKTVGNVGKRLEMRSSKSYKNSFQHNPVC